MLREQPYRLCFPVGVVLGSAGIVHWIAYAHGLLDDYRPVFHVTAQVQGLFSCFAAGFLLTMLPRRLQCERPGHFTVLAVPVGCTVAVALTWFRSFAAAQVVWVTGMAVLLTFAALRIAGLGAGRRAPNAFVWILAGLLMGTGGALLTLVAALQNGSLPLLHQLGQDLVLQGMPLSLVIGVGSMALPLMTRDEATPDGFASGRDAAAIVAHLAAATLLASSFWLAATWSLRAGLALRLTIVAAGLVVAARLWRPPRRPGWNAWLIWASAWSGAAGLALAAAFPGVQRAGLHVTFVLGFALLSMAVAAQVSFGHGGRREEVLGKPPLVPVIAVLMLAAAVARTAMELQPQRYRSWMGAAGVLFLAALLAWGAWVAPMWWPWRAAPKGD